MIVTDIILSRHSLGDIWATSAIKEEARFLALKMLEDPKLEIPTSFVREKLSLWVASEMALKTPKNENIFYSNIATLTCEAVVEEWRVSRRAVIESTRLASIMEEMERKIAEENAKKPSLTSSIPSPNQNNANDNNNTTTSTPYIFSDDDDDDYDYENDVTILAGAIPSLSAIKKEAVENTNQAPQKISAVYDEELDGSDATVYIPDKNASTQKEIAHLQDDKTISQKDDEANKLEPNSNNTKSNTDNADSSENTNIEKEPLEDINILNPIMGIEIPFFEEEEVKSHVMATLLVNYASLPFTMLAKDRSDVQIHLEKCKDCAEDYERIKDISGWSKKFIENMALKADWDTLNLQPDPGPSEEVRAVESQIRAERQKERAVAEKLNAPTASVKEKTSSRKLKIILMILLWAVLIASGAYQYYTWGFRPDTKTQALADRSPYIISTTFKAPDYIKDAVEAYRRQDCNKAEKLLEAEYRMKPSDPHVVFFYGLSIMCNGRPLLGSQIMFPMVMSKRTQKTYPFPWFASQGALMGGDTETARMLLSIVPNLDPEHALPARKQLAELGGPVEIRKRK